MDNPHKRIRLELHNGMVFSGEAFGYPGSSAGEVVFNTAMTGYPESLSDPSYKGQILVLTYPLVGNYGVPPCETEEDLFRHFESDRLHIAGLVIATYSGEYSHWNARESLGNWLNRSGVPGISGIDTRALTKILREEGTMAGKIIFDDQDLPFRDTASENLVAMVSTKETKIYGTGQHRIVLVDCGVKYNILRNLIKRDTTLIRVPWDYPFGTMDCDGLVLSNGPGDPNRCVETIRQLEIFLKRQIPVMGICLGNQLIALATGARTYKLKYGHRSHNQPVLETGTNRAYITSQNHGYAIDPDSLNDEWQPWFINLNDGTNEGIRHRTKAFCAVQFHPEASGGPTDTEFLFDTFIRMVVTRKGP